MLENNKRLTSGGSSGERDDITMVDASSKPSAVADERRADFEACIQIRKPMHMQK